jgi:glucose-6-phosphate isomerase
MTVGVEPLTERPAWQALKTHYDRVRDLHLRKLFADDPRRGEYMTAEAAGIYFDYSKNRITRETIRLLLDLAEAVGLRRRIDAMFRGDKINVSEKRAVMHVALRAPRGASFLVDGENVVPEVHAVLDRMADFSDRIRSGAWKGHTGRRICNVVNIGIGGSDLGPVMAYEALKHYSDRAMTFRFVSNVDGTDLAEAVHDLDAAETPFYRFVENLRDIGDDDQRARGPRLVARGSGRRRKLDRPAFCRRLDKLGGGRQVRHRYR